MAYDSDDTGGRKPYKTYKAKRGRRSSLDDELAGAGSSSRRAPSDKKRRPREQSSRPRHDGHGPGGRNGNGSGSDPAKAYQRYGAADGGKKGRKAAARAGKPAKRRRRFRWWFIPVGFFMIVIIAGVVVTVLAWPGYKKFDRAVIASNHRFNKLDRKTRYELTPDRGAIWRNGTTLVLFGVDSKAGEPARSDTIMLMHFDARKHLINQLSVPRDSRVDLPGRGYDKINAAMFWGGPSLAVKTLKSFLGINVNHVMIVNFQGFPRLVNAIGGVDMYVPTTISTEIGGKGRIVTYKQGMHHFDGKYAMNYVRIRHVDDDFHRAARQQQFIRALQKKLVQPSNITKLPEIGKKFMSGVATDLKTNEILQLAYLKWRAKGGSKVVLEGTPQYVGGIAYVIPPSEAEIQKVVHRFLR